MQCSGGRCAKLIAVCFFVVLVLWMRWYLTAENSLIKPVVVQLDSTAFTSNGSSLRGRCTVDTCLDLLPCSVHNKLTVFVDPLLSVIDKDGIEITAPPSKEYLELRKIIETSHYSVANAEDACLILPGIDTLSLFRFPQAASSLEKSLQVYTRKSNQNLLVFVFLGHELPSSSAIFLRAQSRSSSFRRGYDVALPMWTPDLFPSLMPSESFGGRRYRMAILLKFASKSERLKVLNIFGGIFDMLILDGCSNGGNLVCDSEGNELQLLDAVKECDFTLVYDRIAAYEFLLMIALQARSIPVIVSDTAVLPFDEVIDWSRISVSLYYSRLLAVDDIINTITTERRTLMKRHISFVYEHYFSSLSNIILTSLRILENRIIPNMMNFENEWNEDDRYLSNAAPLFLPRIAPQQGFTAVILAYNREESLFGLIRLLARVPSLVTVIVVWNNVGSKPPAAADWPHINRKIEVIRMKGNRVSNRFIVFPEISTEAVFSLDDDISTLTADEIEFGYQTWRENPDRLVGFLPRSDVLNKSSGLYMYNSEWSNNMSMVLTGAAFYHKYYGILYHSLVPDAMRRYVDKQMNCEDIAMNFFISSITGKPPLKVTPRKKFTCPQCQNNGISPYDAPKIAQRSECINKFVAMMGRNPLKLTVYRVDPVLYRTPALDVRNPFTHVGSL